MARKTARTTASENGTPAKPKATKRAASKSTSRLLRRAPARKKTPARPHRDRSAARAFAGHRREPEEGQVDQQVPGLEVHRQGEHGARPRPPQAEARPGRRKGYAPPTRSSRTRRTPSATSSVRPPGPTSSTWRPTPTAKARRSPGTCSRPLTCRTIGSGASPSTRSPSGPSRRRSPTSARSTWTWSTPRRPGASSTGSWATSSARCSGRRWHAT